MKHIFLTLIFLGVCAQSVQKSDANFFDNDSEKTIKEKTTLEVPEKLSKTTLEVPEELSNMSQDEFFSLMLDTISMIEEVYVDKLPRSVIFHKILTGLCALDTHSQFFSNADFETFITQTKGEFTGIGVEISLEKKGLTVITPLEDGPAYKAGIKNGDNIVAVDEMPVDENSLFNALKMLRGKKGEKVRLTIYREGTPHLIYIDVVRDVIKEKPVKHHIRDNVGYIRITEFNDLTADMVKQAITTIKETLGHKMKGIILDLRNNPGGSLSEVLHVASFFIPQGVVVQVRNQHQQKGSKKERVIPGKLLLDKNIPMVTLVNEGSASAAELLAAALQDHKRSIIVGKKTFGKGSVQVTIPLSKNCGAIKITTARFYSPHGRSIQHEGVIPDIEVDRMKEIVPEQQNSASILEKNMAHTLKPMPLHHKQNQVNTEVLSGEKPRETPSSLSVSQDKTMPQGQISWEDRDLLKEDFQLHTAFQTLQSLHWNMRNVITIEKNHEKESNSPVPGFTPLSAIKP